MVIGYWLLVIEANISNISAAFRVFRINFRNKYEKNGLQKTQSVSGAYENRTHDLLTASQTL